MREIVNYDVEPLMTHDFKMSVWYVDTDQMGIVHHSNYIRYYEAARCDMMKQTGISYAEVEKQGIMMPILDVTSKYISPLYYGEDITIRVSIREIPTVRVTFYYEVFNSADKLVNVGSTTLGFMHADTRRPTRTPKWYLELFEK